MNNKFDINQANFEDINAILQIFEQAKQFMQQNDNPNQWPPSYPGKKLIEKDISRQSGYIITDWQTSKPIGYFFLSTDPDPTYSYIEGAGWLNNKPYATIHRVAIAKPARGIGQSIFKQIMRRHSNIRIDTHKDNLPMQNMLDKLGFKYCGLIYLANGESRLAYQWIR